jgi:hypothetical protein
MARQINLVAFGGLMGEEFSAGLKTILTNANSVKGIDYKEYRQYSEWRDVAAKVMRWKDPTIFLAHSFGVTATMATVRALGKAGPEIPLVIMFDPSQWWWSNWYLMTSGGNTVPDRIGRVVNNYQNGLPIGMQRLARADGSERGIQNRLVTGVVHASIEDVPALQKDAVKLISDYINS